MVAERLDRTGFEFPRLMTLRGQYRQFSGSSGEQWHGDDGTDLACRRHDNGSRRVSLLGITCQPLDCNDALSRLVEPKA